MQYLNILIAVLGAVGTIGSVLFAVHKIIKKFENIDEQSSIRKQENVLIIKSIFAICDGLHQLGANGIVTQTKKELESYVIEK